MAEHDSTTWSGRDIKRTPDHGWKSHPFSMRIHTSWVTESNSCEKYKKNFPDAKHGAGMFTYKTGGCSCRDFVYSSTTGLASGLMEVSWVIGVAPNPFYWDVLWNNHRSIGGIPWLCFFSSYHWCQKPAKNNIYIRPCKNNSLSGWWFGKCFIFPYI